MSCAVSKQGEQIGAQPKLALPKLIRRRCCLRAQKAPLHLQLRRVPLERIDPEEIGAGLKGAIIHRGVSRGMAVGRYSAASQEAQKRSDRQESELGALLASHRDC